LKQVRHESSSANTSTIRSAYGASVLARLPGREMHADIFTTKSLHSGFILYRSIAQTNRPNSDSDTGRCLKAGLCSFAGPGLTHDFRSTRDPAHRQTCWFRHQSKAFIASFANASTQVRIVQLVTRGELLNEKCTSCFIFGESERRCGAMLICCRYIPKLFTYEYRSSCSLHAIYSYSTFPSITFTELPLISNLSTPSSASFSVTSIPISLCLPISTPCVSS
jgi:hypothetical protein